MEAWGTDLVAALVGASAAVMERCLDAASDLAFPAPESSAGGLLVPFDRAELEELGVGA